MSAKTPAPVLAMVGMCAFSLAAFGAQTPKPAKATIAPAGSAGKPPFIVDNPDGTFTVQKAPAHGKKGAAKKGLVIPPQVFVPELRPPTSHPARPSH